ncbi:cyclase family protein [Zavarzinia sp. CC-PAN008]|uniref:cyclase family protein n=1 Tax=Zavarzinia sp. CC-PAN008 TaxID=3243332 RepID=UPI003F748E1F
MGRLNLITPEKVKQGIAEVKEGRTFCCSLPLDYPGGELLSPGRGPPKLRPAGSAAQPMANLPLSRLMPGCCDVINDDVVEMVLQYSSQWDTFCHVGQEFDANGDGVAEPVFYNGFRAGIDVPGVKDWNNPADPDADLSKHIGAHKLGVETFAEKCIQGRAVLIDLHAHFGNERKWVGRAELDQVMKADNVVVEPGDIVLLHTGFGQLLLDMKKQPDPDKLHNSCSVLDGRDDALLDWITQSGVAAICADNYAVEGFPGRPMATDATDRPLVGLPLHGRCLFELGVPLGELWYFTELAKWLRGAKRTRCLLTAPPLRLPGAVGSPANAIATV